MVHQIYKLIESWEALPPKPTSQGHDALGNPRFTHIAREKLNATLYVSEPKYHD